MARRHRRPVSKAGKQARATAQGTMSAVDQDSFVLPDNGRSSILAFELSIQLKSDLCPGSGDGFSSGIDQDVCINAEGLPYISGRRIKGCLREAAIDIEVHAALVDALFGVSGDRASGALTVSSANIDEPVTTGGVSATVDRYAYTRAQTKIDRDTGSVAEGTLRFMRVVKHYAPDGNELRFVSRMTVDCNRFGSDAERDDAIEQLRRCARAMRNMGMGRNRKLTRRDGERNPV